MRVVTKEKEVSKHKKNTPRCLHPGEGHYLTVRISYNENTAQQQQLTGHPFASTSHLATHLHPLPINLDNYTPPSPVCPNTGTGETTQARREGTECGGSKQVNEMDRREVGS